MFRNLVLLFILICAHCFPHNVHADSGEGVTFIVKSSPQAKYKSHYYIAKKSFAKQLLKTKKVKTNEMPELPYAYAKIGRKENAYIITYDLNLYHPEKQIKYIPSSTIKHQLKTYIEELRGHHFGKAVPWTEAKRIFPRMGFAEVTDLETGLSFSVQRRAGSRHADVQPLTAHDSKVMKEIYGGKWSWKRRAILVKTKGQILAASMNGMPHGAGAIAGNDFPGHFCIHFKDSTTHKQNHPDPGHDYMVLKATGNLVDHLVTEQDAKAICSTFVSALHEKDYALIPFFLNQAEPDQLEKIMYSLDKVESIKLLTKASDKPLKSDGLEEDVATRLRFKQIGHKEISGTVVFHFIRSSVTDRWILQIKPLMEQLGLQINVRDHNDQSRGSSSAFLC